MKGKGLTGSIRVAELLDKAPELELSLLAGSEGLDREILTVDVNRPGLALAGFYKNLASDRIQVFGRGEFAFLQECSPEQKRNIHEEFLKYDFPGIVFTHGNRPVEDFLSFAEKSRIPIFSTPLSTHKFIIHYWRYLSEELAPSTALHGVLIEVYGVGILLKGTSGIGKSETALELVERGHRLIADDMVHIKCVGDTDLYGFSSDVIRYHMELRGLGIINVKDLFGVGAIRRRKRIELIVHLEDWDPEKEYDRLGLEEETETILGVKLPRIVVPVRPGRNIPILIETAAMNHRSKIMGYHAARELTMRINEEIQKKAVKSGVQGTIAVQNPAVEEET